MGILDIILLLCFVPGVIRGFVKGFVSRAVSLVSIILGAIVAHKFSGMLSAALAPSMGKIDEKTLKIISFAIILIAAIVLLKIIGSLITKMMKKLDVNWLNRILGVILAVFTTAIILGLLIHLFDGVNAKFTIVKPEVLTSSPVYTAIQGFAEKLFPFLHDIFIQTSVYD